MNNGDAQTSFSILIVDDESKNIQLLGTILKDNGYEVEFAMDGEKALEWVQNKAFDLVLLDIMMPEMDGYEICRKIKRNKSRGHIPVIFITAKTESDDIVKGFEAGGSDYITKPFKTPELLARVKIQVEMKVLRGFLPICSSCKKIRDDQGYWRQVEEYISGHSPVVFSHGYCPQCYQEELKRLKAWEDQRQK